MKNLKTLILLGLLILTSPVFSISIEIRPSDTTVYRSSHVIFGGVIRGGPDSIRLIAYDSRGWNIPRNFTFNLSTDTIDAGDYINVPNDAQFGTVDTIIQIVISLRTYPGQSDTAKAYAMVIQPQFDYGFPWEGSLDLVSPPPNLNLKVHPVNNGIKDTATSLSFYVIGNDVDTIYRETRGIRIPPGQKGSYSFSCYVSPPYRKNIVFVFYLGRDENPFNDTIDVFTTYFPGWHKMNVIVRPPQKGIKGGGGITAIDYNIYLLVGSNTRDFMKYSILGNSWSPLCSLNFGKKKVKKGACIVNDGDKVYAFKGGGTNEFYRYNPATNTWDSLPGPGFTKGVKGGFATVVELSGTKYIYAGSGSGTNEWKRFNISSGTWEAANPANLPGEKAKIGSGLTTDGSGKIYFLQAGGKKNYFWYADLNTEAPTWVKIESLPLRKQPDSSKKKVKEGGCIEYYDGKVYAVKGGNTKEFWYYEPTGDSWHYVGEVGGATPPVKGIKTGRTLVFSDSAAGIYCLPGNNTNEFWYYYPPDFPLGKIPQPMTTKPMTTTVTRISHGSINGGNYRGLNYNYGGRTSIAEIFDVSGRLITKNLKSGVYFIRIRISNTSETRKLLIVK